MLVSTLWPISSGLIGEAWDCMLEKPHCSFVSTSFSRGTWGVGLQFPAENWLSKFLTRFKRYLAHLWRFWFARFCLRFWHFQKIRFVMCSQVWISQWCFIVSLTREAFQNTWAGRTTESVFIPGSMGDYYDPKVWEILIKGQHWNAGLNSCRQYDTNVDFVTFQRIHWRQVQHNTLPGKWRPRLKTVLCSSFEEFDLPELIEAGGVYGMNGIRERRYLPNQQNHQA